MVLMVPINAVIAMKTKTYQVRFLLLMSVPNETPPPILSGWVRLY